MKRFVFKLQTLLNIKQSFEKEQLAKLLECDALIARLNGELAALRDSFEQMRLEYNQKAASGMVVSSASNYVSGFEFLKDSIEAKKDEIAVAEADRLKIQLKLIEIKRDIKVYEKLREKQYEEYLKEVKLEEDNLIGDILSYKVTTEG